MNDLRESPQNQYERRKKSSRGSHPSTRKSRSISRYFLGNKRTSFDVTTQDIDISRCLTSNGIFDSCDLWTSVTLFRDYTTCRRLFILTDKNQLIIGKFYLKQSLLKVKQCIDIYSIWFIENLQHFHDPTALEITSLTYFDAQRSAILGWPLAENYLVEFDSSTIRETWLERIRSARRFWLELNFGNVEHVRIVIDQNPENESNQTTNNNNNKSFLIRKVICARVQDTVRDLIEKCIDASHLQDVSVDDYTLFVYNDIQTNNNSSNNSSINNNQGFHQHQWIPLIGHEYPYAIKMKQIKATTNLNFESDEHLSSAVNGNKLFYSSPRHHHSTASLNTISSNGHDFELRRRDLPHADHSNKRLRFFHKRKSKDLAAKLVPQPSSFYEDPLSSSSTTTPTRSKNSSQFFGQSLALLIQRYNQQIPPVLQQLLEILYYKGPEMTGIFRKVANARSVKESIEKIERNIPLHEDDLHPILAAGILKHFLRNLPEPIFNASEYDQWKKCLRLSSLNEKICFSRKSIFSTLPNPNHLLLKGFICVLHRISQNAESNGMNPFNLGLCVSNSLFKTESTTISSGKQEADVMSSIVEFLIVNCTSIFGSDVLTCVADKRIIVHEIPNRSRPAASSIESLDEVESSPHLPVVNRSRDSGLATSDQPLNDDSSEISENVRRQTPTFPSDWSNSIACGKGIVVTSIILPTSMTNYRNRQYKPSKQFLQREFLTNDTTDDSENENNIAAGDSSLRSSTTTVNNMSISKSKRNKTISRHSSLGSSEYQQQQQQQQQKQNQLNQQINSSNNEPKRISNADVKRTSSLKQFHYSSDEGDLITDQFRKMATSLKKKKSDSPRVSSPNSVQRKTSINERRSRSHKTKNNDEETMSTRSSHLEQQDLDLLSEPLSSINNRLSSNVNNSRSASMLINKNAENSPSYPRSIPTSVVEYYPRCSSNLSAGRSRHNGPLAATNESIYRSVNPRENEQNRTFVHQNDNRSFQLSKAIEMKPSEENIPGQGRRRPCHRQNALRYKSIDQETSEKINESRNSSVERRPSSISTRKSSSFDIFDELRPSDVSWSVREKAKLFEHSTKLDRQRFSTGRENYV